MLRGLLCTALGFCAVATASALTSYQPLGLLSPSSGKGIFHPIKPADRLVLPGLRPPEAELLQKTLEQRYRRSLAQNPDRLARLAVPKIFSDQGAFARARGIYAELRFTQSNPYLGLVGSRTATQNDLYMRPVFQRAPLGIQIKTHSSSNPVRYAEDMVRDYRARWFVVPDDHVQGVKAYWQEEGRQLQIAGKPDQALAAFKQASRVRPLGASINQLKQEMSHGGRILLREQNAQYVSLGAVIVMAAGPAISAWASEGYLPADHAARLGNAAVLLSASYGANQYLRYAKGGALRGSLRGNAITGLTLVFADGLFTFFEYGGTKAFRRPEFYERMGGSIGATSLGLTIGIPVGVAVMTWAAPTGPWAPVIGGTAGFAAGTLAGAAGYFGGVRASRYCLALVAPELLLESDLVVLKRTRTQLESELAKASAP